jgi:hypothetical protein
MLFEGQAGEMGLFLRLIVIFARGYVGSAFEGMEFSQLSGG